MRRIPKKLLLFMTVFPFAVNLAAVDNAHFYKAPLLHRTPTTGWFDEAKNYENSDWLTKFDFTYAYGDSSTSWNHNGDTTSLLNTTGNHNMLYLMENVVVLPTVQHFATFLANAQINHWATNSTFGQLEFDGKFQIHDININLRQNLVSGFFFELLVPIRDVSIKDIHYIDLSPETGRFSKQTGEWRQFLNQFDTLLANYGYKPHATSYSTTDVGDISLNLGWQGIKKYGEEEEALEFLGFMLKAGVLFPSGKKDDVDYCFSVPTGYNGHWGINFNAQLDIGFNDWITVSAHGSATVFFDEDEEWHRMKTFSGQNGFIKLEKGKAEEEKGTLWHAGADIKFDHVGVGLSLLVGYSFNKQENDTLNPADKDKFDYTLVNADSALAGWEMHVLHFMADYDFSVHMSENSKWAPRISVFYNWPFDGESVFKTETFGGGLGIDVRWKI